MKIRHSHGTTFTFTFILSLCIPFLSLATDTITPTQPLTFNHTLVSKNQFFELGFFDLAGKGSYLGIWFKQIEPKTYVWVANRDSPITSSSPKLTVAGNVVLVDDTGATVWSTNQSVRVGGTTVVQLLDSGNLVLRYENDDTSESYIWESFDFPTDTLLPEMKLGWSRKTGINRVMRSWKNKNDPGIGDYSFEMNLNGFPEIVLSNKETKTITLRSGPWNGKGVSGVPEMKVATIMKFEFEETSDEITYSFKMMNNSIISRLVLDSSGNLLRYIWVVTTRSWSLYWSFPRDMCDRYGECGPFGVCDVDSSPICKCLRGFRPRFRQAWVNLRDGSGGCVRSSELECGSDGFLLLKNVKLPDGSRAVVDRRLNLSECEEVCRRNCNCTAYASMDSIGLGCVIWAVELMDTRQLAGSDSGEQDLYVRVAASDLDQSATTGGSKQGSSDSNRVVKIVAITVGSFFMIVTVLILFYLKRKNIRLLKKSMTYKTGKRSYYDGTRMDELELPLFDFTTLVTATDNFSDANKLGEGGFGCVYKGTLTEREVVAVKRLSRVSDQGIEELINEVRSIAKLQHKNLVRLVGCCIEVEEKLLIYEFVENKSLNTFLFDKEKSAQLNWQVRLNIICGISRGILYLHQDSRFKIIHRDLKASNVLLDNKMNPKISDFGMARIFGSDDQTEAKTKRVVGTYGYMSPEYAMDGHFSTKSDVFSFGVLVLEIVSGQKNKGSSYTSGQLNLLSHTWTLWKEGKALELVDELLRGEFPEDEALRCIQIGLLCVQEQPKDRPSMSKVLMMLDNETAQLPKPKYPGFFFGKRNITEDSSSKKEDSTSLNEVSITMLDGR